MSAQVTLEFSFTFQDPVRFLIFRPELGKDLLCSGKSGSAAGNGKTIPGEGKGNERDDWKQKTSTLTLPSATSVSTPKWLHRQNLPT